jgi:poly-gamma-glutamate synthase PgsB/CapB
MKSTSVVELLEHGLNLYQCKLFAELTHSLAAEFHRLPQYTGWLADESLRPPLPQQIVLFLQQKVTSELHKIAELRRRYAAFNTAYVNAESVEDKQLHILEYARDLGATPRQLRQDRKAFARWFGHDAMTDRFSRRLHTAEYRLSFYVERLGALVAVAIEKYASATQREQLWRRLRLEETVKPLFSYDGDPRVGTAALRCLATVLPTLPAGRQEHCVTEEVLQFLYRVMLDRRMPVWSQCEALSVLPYLSPSSLGAVLQLRLHEPGQEDDFFVRRRAVRLLAERLPQVPTLEDILPLAVQDESPFVRQAAAEALLRVSSAKVRTWLRTLARDDAVAQVRGAAVRMIIAMVDRPDLVGALQTLLVEVMEYEKDEFVLRVATHVAAESTRRLREAESPCLASWREGMIESLERLHVHAERLPVRRWAALARERIWCETNPRARTLRDAVQQQVATLEAGKSRRLPRKLFAEYDEITIGRVLSVLAQEDYGFDLQRHRWGDWIMRGHRFGFRLWRALYEFKHPSPDKRQAFRHTVGRIFSGTLRAPSAIFSELAETKVPGEPLFISTEAGWRPYLPLVDEAISSLQHGLSAPTIRFCTAEGVTELTPPRSLLQRVRAFYKLTTEFADYARLRNWRESGQVASTAYLDKLAALGFTISLRSHTDGQDRQFSADPAVMRFFPRLASALLPFSLWSGPNSHQPLTERVGSLWEQLQDYFVSVYENSLPDLAIFAGVAALVFFGRHLYCNYQQRHARQSVPLVLGGWGTRGKSGTERLKAGLVSGLGHGLVSKTTGCEAMFLYAYPYGQTREMFLFRPYDKATIWEQCNIVWLATKLKVQVFLWECMGLTPAYVQILQRHWMRDDISTITNTYPDHEDVQGPAGVNIPQVMTCFMPAKGKLFTTEEQMRPILTEAARRLQTSITGIGWLEAGLLTNDVLKRFPYEEHPFNISLVLGLAEEMGIDRDFAVKEMADRVVADLGVLKTSPPAPLRTRLLEFANGMSANERHGCISNWIRLGFDTQDPVKEPGVWVTTVVNNRADRIPRSRVFAGILVNDVSADMHVLIGGNLTGLVAYIRESWDDYIRQISLWGGKPDATPADGVQMFTQMAHRFRQPYHEEQIRARVRAALVGINAALARAATYKEDVPPALDVEALETLWNDPNVLRTRLTSSGIEGSLIDGVIKHLTQWRTSLSEYRELVETIERSQASDRETLDTAFRELLWKWFQAKIVVLSDYYATGDQIINRICDETPPGFRNRVMGIQNIKGTGLDFVYRWQAWETCQNACTQLRSNELTIAARGLRALAVFQDYGVLCEEYVQETVVLAKGSPLAQREGAQTDLALILSNLDTVMHKVRERLTAASHSTGGRWDMAIEYLEKFLDAGDAVKRRKKANQIYRDMITERISHERAVLELQYLTKRQKGGWLFKAKKA